MNEQFVAIGGPSLYPEIREEKKMAEAMPQRQEEESEENTLAEREAKRAKSKAGEKRAPWLPRR